MEPISLRTITTLLNYERVTSDPRFQNVGLLKSSFADDDMVRRMVEAQPTMFDGAPPTIQNTNTHMFMEMPSNGQFTTHPNHPTTCVIHPIAAPQISNLNPAQIELIFHETRGHSGCFKAIGLYGMFFELCPPNQKIAIQITNEPPLIVDASSARMIGFNVVGPRLRTMTTFPSAPLVTTTGFENAECHSILGFSSINGTSPYTVVDMTRMQYGAAGGGEHGEVYFIGSLVDYRGSMQHICANLESFYELPLPIPDGDDSELAARLRACANRAWQRWNDREVEGWCDYCGKGGKDLKRCGSCKIAKVKYCCKEHQKLGWKLHKHTCESNGM